MRLREIRIGRIRLGDVRAGDLGLPEMTGRAKVRLLLAGGILAAAIVVAVVRPFADKPEPVPAAVVDHDAALTAAAAAAEEELLYDLAEAEGPPDGWGSDEWLEEPEQPRLKPSRTPIPVDPEEDEEDGPSPDPGRGGAR